MENKKLLEFAKFLGITNIETVKKGIKHGFLDFEKFVGSNNTIEKDDFKMTKTVNFYNITSKVEFKQDFSNLELLGAKQFLKEVFGVKGEKAYKLSSYHSEPAMISLTQTIGTKNQLTVQDYNDEYYVIQFLQVTDDGILYAITNDEKQLKIELGSLTN